MTMQGSEDNTTADRIRGIAASVQNDVRPCAKCGLWKPTSEFHVSLTGQFSYCRDCRNAYDRRYYQERGRSARRARQRARVNALRAWMVSLKDGVPCTDCGELFPPWVMHWDHLPGHEKIDAVSEMVINRSRTLVLDELKKCELVCANCHVMRTISRAGRSSAR